MDGNKKHTTNLLSANVNRFREYEILEMEQVINRIFSLEKTRLELNTFLGTASLTALAAGFTLQNITLLIISLILLIILWIYETKARKQHLIYYYRGLFLQRKLSGNKKNSFLEYHTSEHAKEAKRILDLDEKDRITAINDTKIHTRGIFFYLIYLIIICEIVVIEFLIFTEHWSIFAK